MNRATWHAGLQDGVGLGDQELSEVLVAQSTEGLLAIKKIGPGRPFIQLYDMGRDKGERHNLASAMTARVKELRNLLDRQIAAGRSTPGES